jgi:hypothetical protein
MLHWSTLQTCYSAAVTLQFMIDGVQNTAEINEGSGRNAKREGWRWVGGGYTQNAATVQYNGLRISVWVIIKRDAGYSREAVRNQRVRSPLYRKIRVTDLLLVRRL